METTPKKNGDESAEEREKLSTEPIELSEPDLKKAENQAKSHRWEPKAYRAHDFAHVHPSHARHKTFGMDHEPGAF